MTLEEYITYYPGECHGCRLFFHGYNLAVEMKEAEDIVVCIDRFKDCPCKTCLIKMKCSEACEAFWPKKGLN